MRKIQILTEIKIKILSKSIQYFNDFSTCAEPRLGHHRHHHHQYRTRFSAKPRHVPHFMLIKPGREGNSISGPAHTQTEATDRIFNLRGIQGCHAHHECKADSHSHFIWPGHKQRISSEAALIRPFRGKFMPATSAVKWPKKWEKK